MLKMPLKYTAGHVLRQGGIGADVKLYTEGNSCLFCASVEFSVEFDVISTYKLIYDLGVMNPLVQSGKMAENCTNFDMVVGYDIKYRQRQRNWTVL